MKTNPRLLANLPAPLSEHQLEDRFDDYLDEAYDVIELMGVTVMPHEFLRKHDETAYRCAFNDWLDGEIGESLVEYDGECYSKDSFDSAVADTVLEIVVEIDEAQERITAAQEEVNDFDEREHYSERIRDLESEVEALENEKSNLENL